MYPLFYVDVRILDRFYYGHFLCISLLYDMLYIGMAFLSIDILPCTVISGACAMMMYNC